MSLTIMKLTDSRFFKMIRKNINYICRFDWNGRCDFVNYNASYVRSLLDACYSFEEINAEFMKSKSENVRFHWGRIAKEFTK